MSKKAKEVQLLLTCTVVPGWTARTVTNQARAALKETFRDSGVTSTIELHTPQPVHIELQDSYQALQDDYNTRREAQDKLALDFAELQAKHAALQEAHKTACLQLSRSDSVISSTVQVVNAIVAAINNVDHTPPSISWQKGEYYKKGARDTLSKIGTAVRAAAMELLSEIPLAGDEELFAYWVQEASRRPARVAKALISCSTAQEYRDAIRAMRDGDAANPPAIGTEGQVVGL